MGRDQAEVQAMDMAKMDDSAFERFLKTLSGKFAIANYTASYEPCMGAGIRDFEECAAFDDVASARASVTGASYSNIRIRTVSYNSGTCSSAADTETVRSYLRNKRTGAQRRLEDRERKAEAEARK